MLFCFRRTRKLSYRITMALLMSLTLPLDPSEPPACTITYWLNTTMQRQHDHDNIQNVNTRYKLMMTQPLRITKLLSVFARQCILLHGKQNTPLISEIRHKCIVRQFEFKITFNVSQWRSANKSKAFITITQRRFHTRKHTSPWL